MMTKKELWEDIQKNDKQAAEVLLLLKKHFGKIELIDYEKLLSKKNGTRKA